MIDETTLSIAADWHAQVCADTVDWDAFTVWLEADRRHARAYDAAAVVEGLLENAAAPSVAPKTRSGISAPLPRLRWRRWTALGLGALAAAAVAVAFMPGRIAHDQWQTADSARSLALADGTRIVLAPHSRLTRDGNHLALWGGAIFAVAHRPGRNLTIAAGALSISDIGTHFDLRTDGAIVRLVLDEGQVAVSGAGIAKPVAVLPGQALQFDPAQGQLVIATAPAGSVGDWEQGQLSYRDAPLTLVAADIARYCGTTLRVDGALTRLHFSGTLRFGPGHDPAQDLAQLMALHLDRSGRMLVLHGPGSGDRPAPAGSGDAIPGAKN